MINYKREMPHACQIIHNCRIQHLEYADILLLNHKGEFKQQYNLI